MNHVVVSIHDVSPLTWQKVERMILEFGDLPTSLLVIPNHHERGHFLQNPSFCEWLQRQSRNGHEIVMHGYHHRRPIARKDSFRDRLITRIYTAGEGEFYDIDEETAYQLVTRAMEEFRQISLEPDGFIAPAWLLSAPAENALRRAGIRYTTRIHEVLDLQKGVHHPSQSLVWSVRAAWRRSCSLGWNAWLLRRMHDAHLLRIGIHPPDLDHPKIWKQIRECVRTALADRQAITYSRWVRGQS